MEAISSGQATSLPLFLHAAFGREEGGKIPLHSMRVRNESGSSATARWREEEEAFSIKHCCKHSYSDRNGSPNRGVAGNGATRLLVQ